MVMKSLQRRADNIDDILVMPTMFDRRTQSSHSSLRHLQTHYPEFIWQSVIPVDTQLRNASKAGIPPAHFSPASQGVHAYKRLLNYLMQTEELDCAG